MTMTWARGRQLTSIANTPADAASYAYNMDGVRTSKTVAGKTTTFILDTNGAMVGEIEPDGSKLLYIFGADGSKIGFSLYNSSNTLTGTYDYVFNAQGDVTALLQQNTGGGYCSLVATYQYDTWGKLIASTDTSSINIAALNPIRYRGYYYDSETGFYATGTRYYDPVVGRFINGDVIMGMNKDATGYNVFAYCGNNPVNRIDPTGMFWWSVALAALAVVVVCAAVVVLAPVAIPAIGAVAAGVAASAAVDTAIVAAAVAVSASMIASVEEPLAGTASITTAPAIAATAARSIPDDIGNVLRGYKNGQCVNAAMAVRNLLRNNNEHGIIIMLVWPNANEYANAGGRIGTYVWCVSQNRAVGDLAFHIGIEYKGIVYCNIHPEGMPEAEWIADFEMVDPSKMILRVPF